MNKALKFKIGKMEYLFPKEQGMNYTAMEEVRDKANVENPPIKGKWQVGTPIIYDLQLLNEMHELGVIPKDFFDLPVVSGAFYSSWLANNRKKKFDGESFVGWLKPYSDNMVTWVTTTQPWEKQNLFLTNWATS